MTEAQSSALTPVDGYSQPPAPSATEYEANNWALGRQRHMNLVKKIIVTYEQMRNLIKKPFLFNTHVLS